MSVDGSLKNKRLCYFSNNPYYKKFLNIAIILYHWFIYVLDWPFNSQHINQENFWTNLDYSKGEVAKYDLCMEAVHWL